MTREEMFNLTPFDIVYVIQEGSDHIFKYGQKLTRVVGGGDFDDDLSIFFEDETGQRNYVMHHDISFTNPLTDNDD